MKKFLKVSHESAARIALAMMLEGKSCEICGIEYKDVDHCIERGVVAVTAGASKVACGECYSKNREERKVMGRVINVVAKKEVKL